MYVLIEKATLQDMVLGWRVPTGSQSQAALMVVISKFDEILFLYQ